MQKVLACIDGSTYAASVGDHAAWFAERMAASIELLHVETGLTDAAEQALLSGVAGHLHDQGVTSVSRRVGSGTFVDVVARSGADLIVLGKRGADSQEERLVLGAHVDAVLRATVVPVCLTSKIFLPIERVLVVLDSNPDHRAALAFAMSHPGLAGLSLDLVVITATGEDTSAKIALARAELRGQEAEVFAVEADRPGAAVEGYMASRGIDLIVISRAALMPAGAPPLGPINPTGLWNARTPVIVC
ncbi:MAG: universal stress protein [Alphaproteobacteria bacterium]|nr:universal stress protein [Alphaproteobacteria bacterium]